MIVSFQILKNNNGNFVPLSNKEAQSVSIGGYSFEIKDYMIPFDWDAFYGSEHNNIFYFETGRGFLFNDYEISDCYDETYEEIGITREEITAEFLASTTHIEEFFVYFDDSDGMDHSLGWYADNTDNPQYKINLLEMSFLDMNTNIEHIVAREVLNRYNKGEYNE